MLKRILCSFKGVHSELRDKKYITRIVFIQLSCLCVGVLGWAQFGGFSGQMWACSCICGLASFWMI